MAHSNMTTSQLMPTLDAGMHHIVSVKRGGGGGGNIRHPTSWELVNGANS